LWGMNVTVPLKNNPHAFSIVLLLIAALMTLSIYIFHKKRWI
jgi:Mg2+ and Co2+ transporter CorA